jgi:glycosyltransferase involved in cell wall biosynthesis
MKVLFMHSNLGYGGIETLLLRLSNYFIDTTQDEIRLFITRKNNLQLKSLFNKKIKIYCIGNFFTEVFFKYTFLKKYFAVDVIYCSGIQQLIFCLILTKIFFSSAKIMIGVYHPNEFFLGKGLISKSLFFILKLMPAENFIFMNNLTKENSQKFLDRSFSKSYIIPLPILIPEKEVQTRPVNKSRIVSIGRITNFKTYNFTMLNALEALANKGIFVEYHIYGDGEQRAELEKVLLTKPLIKNNVFLHDSLPYEEIGNILLDAFIFVGMGTALLEAVSYGVPALVAIINEKQALTYGFFGEIANYRYNVGEVDSTLDRFLFAKKIEFLLKANENMYKKIVDAGMNELKIFSINKVGKQYRVAFQGAIAFSYKLPRIIFFMILPLIFGRVFHLKNIRSLSKRYDQNI